MENLVLLMIFVAAAAYFFVRSATDGDEKNLDEDHQYVADLRRLSKEGYVLDEMGLTACMVCGSNCGQCGSSNDRDGLTLEQYRLRYWTTGDRK